MKKNAQGMYRVTIGADGRVTFPKEFLRSIGITDAKRVFITTNGRDIVFKECIEICSLCSGSDNMIEGFPVCRECAKKVADLLKLS